MRDDLCAGLLEGLAAGDVVVMVMAVDQVFDRRLGDLLDFLDVGLRRLRPAVADGSVAITPAGDDEHCLMVAVAENVDVVGSLDLCRGESRRRGRRARRRPPGGVDGAGCAGVCDSD